MTKVPMLFIPGLLSSGEVFHHQITHLQELVFPAVVLAFSDAPERMLEEVLKAAPPKFLLCGHSMGGWLCLEVMKRCPDRVLGLVLLNTTSRGDSLEKKDRRNRMIQKTLGGEFEDVLYGLSEYLVFKEDIKPSVLNMFKSIGQQVFCNQQRAMLQRTECVSVLSKIKVPTLILHASKDQNFCFEEQIEMHHAILNSKLAVIEDCGHMSPMENPQAVTALIRFWLEYDCLELIKGN